MPVICIGPVCIPWTCLPAIVFFLWRFVKPLLPKAWAAVVEEWATKVCDVCAPYVEKIPGLGKKKKKAAGGQAANGHGGEKAATKPGEVGHIESPEQLDALLERSKAEGSGIVLDFTAPWCNPCQKIKPKFKALASEYSGHCFAEVDADELDAIAARYEVMGLPAFKVFRAGEQVGSLTGANEEKLAALLQQHLGTEAETKKDS